LQNWEEIKENSRKSGWDKWDSVKKRKAILRGNKPGEEPENWGEGYLNRLSK